MNVKHLQISSDDFRKLRSKIKYNFIIGNYYNNAYAETLDVSWSRKASAINSCSKYWDINNYVIQRVRDVLRVSTCRDRFCEYCMAKKAKQRYVTFAPVLDLYAEDYSMYHVTFTVPNCSGSSLRMVLDRMYVKFPYLVRYLSGRSGVRGIDFSQYGYAGCIRSLEITTSMIDGELTFHPHFHCIFLLKKGLRLKKDKLNKFSFSNRSSKVRAFSEFEILLQKIWYLLNNTIKVNYKNIQKLTVGYSGVCDKIKPGEYHEVFKYTLKDSTTIIRYSEDAFWFLYHALLHRRAIQGYGCLYNFDFEADLDNEEAEDLYIKTVLFLSSREVPYRMFDTLDEVQSNMSNSSNVIYISKKSIREGLRLDEKL